MTSIKGHNSITNMQKMTGNNPNLDLVNINAYTMHVQNLVKIFLFALKIFSKKSDINQLISYKGVRAFRGYFCPPMRSKIKIALHKFLLISLLEQ